MTTNYLLLELQFCLHIDARWPDLCDLCVTVLPLSLAGALVTVLNDLISLVFFRVEIHLSLEQLIRVLCWEIKVTSLEDECWLVLN